MTDTILRQPNGSIDYEAYKGMEGTVDINGMSVNVVVTDARVCYGRLDLCVEPKSGVGFRWIDYKNVSLTETPKPTTSTPSFAEVLQSIRERATLIK